MTDTNIVVQEAPAPTALAPDSGDARGVLIAAGAAGEAWPENWREQMVGDDRRGLKTAKRFKDPMALWKAYRELREQFDGGRSVRVPTGESSEEERAALHRALGVPDSPEDYFDLIALPDGEVLGEADRPVAEDFARAVHGAGATPEVMSAALGWYLQNQETQQVAIDQADQDRRAEAQRALRDAWGPAQNRMINAIGALFADRAGGTDIDGDGLFARLMGGRMGDGRMIGDDPDVLKFLGDLAMRLRPSATVTGAGDERAADIAGRIREIEEMMRNNDPRYWKDDAVQQEYRELIELRR